MWNEPKTDWQATDKYTHSDYNRLVGNIRYLYDFSLEMYKDYEILDMNANVTVETRVTPDLFNIVEVNLDRINKATYNLRIGDQKSFVENGHPWNAEELNRIESACVKLYNQLTSQYAITSKFKPNHYELRFSNNELGDRE